MSEKPPNNPTLISLKSSFTYAIPPNDDPHLVIRQMDWRRLRRQAVDAKVESDWCTVAYSILWGIAGNGVFSLIALYTAEKLPAWVIPATWIVTILSLLVGIVLWQVGCTLKDKGAQAKTALVTDMDEISAHLRLSS